MKTIEDLEKKYEEFQIRENNITSYNDFCYYLSRVIYDVEKACDEVFIQIEENHKWRKKNKLKDLLPKFFVQEAQEFYGFDNSILLETSDLLVHNLENFIRIRNIADENNFKELNKLVDFLLANHENNIKYLNSRKNSDTRNSLLAVVIDNNISAMDGFANKKISPYEEKEKQFVKTNNK